MTRTDWIEALTFWTLLAIMGEPLIGTLLIGGLIIHLHAKGTTR